MIYVKYYLKRVLKLVFLLSLKPYEHLWKGRMKCLFFKRNSEVLAIVFSGLDAEDNKRVFNYVKGLRKLRVNLLFLSDPYGYRGSYYWKEEGTTQPYDETETLIATIINKGNYSKIITLGSSKGGSAAILHGFKIGANCILACANQFKIGSYISEYPKVFKHMVGVDVNDTDIENLNHEYETLLQTNYKGSELHLIYSTNEPIHKTYNANVTVL